MDECQFNNKNQRVQIEFNNREERCCPLYPTFPEIISDIPFSEKIFILMVLFFLFIFSGLLLLAIYAICFAEIS